MPVFNLHNENLHFLNKKLISWILFILLSLIWGSSFKLMKVGLISLSPYEVATIRILTAGLLLLPFGIKELYKLKRKEILQCLYAALLGSFFAAYLFCVAETKIDGSLAGMLNALTPFFTILIGVIVFKAHFSIYKYFGIAIGFIGLCALFYAKGTVDVSNIAYSSLIVLATILYGTNVQMVSRHAKHIPPLTIVAVGFTLLIIPCVLILFTIGYFHHPYTKLILLSTGASAVLGIFGTAITSILFYKLIHYAGSIFASMVTYAIPVVAMFWGLYDGEYINVAQLAALGIVLIGVYIVNKKPASIKTKDIVEDE